MLTTIWNTLTVKMKVTCRGISLFLDAPSLPLSADLLNRWREYFQRLQFVERAAYAVWENGGKKSYVIVFDMRTYLKQDDDALEDISVYLGVHGLIPKDLRWPIQLATWKSLAGFDAIVADNPELVFYTKQLGN